MRGDRRRSGSQALAGVLLLTVGSLLFAQNLDLFEMRQYWRYWPVLPLGIGLLKLFTARSRGDQAFGIFLTCLGAGQLARMLSLSGLRADGPPERLLRVFNDSTPAVFLYHARGVQGINRRVQGVRMDLRGELVNLIDWHIVAP